MSYDEPMYLISVVSKKLQIHPQTLRQYEREGLIEPGRTGGKVRMYSQQDIDKIKLILRFTRDLGVNLAGVSVILQLKSQLEIYEQMLKSKSSDFAPCVDALIDSAMSKSSGALIKRSSSEIAIYSTDEE